MGRLIDDLLAFSRMGRSPIERRRISLAEVVRDARQDLPPMGNAAAIAWTVHPLPEVEADPTAPGLRQPALECREVQRCEAPPDRGNRRRAERPG